MKPNSQPAFSPQEGQKARSLSDRVWSVIMGTPSEEAKAVEFNSLESFFDKLSSAESHQAETIKRALSCHPGISEKLNALLDPKLSITDCLQDVVALDEEFGVSRGDQREKNYESVFYLPNGAKLCIRLYPELDRVSFKLF